MRYVSDDNFLVYAAQHYDNPSCATESDFKNDLNRFKFLLKMFKKYSRDGIINERLVLNHIVLIYNVFHRDAATRMLVLKMEGHLELLKPFLVKLNLWPDYIKQVGSEDAIIIGSDIPMDQMIIEKLRKI